MNILMTTNVGSHMWKMNHAQSDTDLFHIFQQPTDDILIGKPFKQSIQKSDKSERPAETVDHSYHEIGKVLNMLEAGNVNFIWGALSPIVLTEFNPIGLRELAMESLSQECYHSINGLATHNYRKYIYDRDRQVINPKGLPDWKFAKKLKVVRRTLEFGIGILQDRGVRFDPVSDCDWRLILELIEALHEARDNSPLPKKCPNVDDMDRWILEWRIRELRG